MELQSAEWRFLASALPRAGLQEPPELFRLRQPAVDLEQHRGRGVEAEPESLHPDPGADGHGGAEPYYRVGMDTRNSDRPLCAAGDAAVPQPAPCADRRPL